MKASRTSPPHSPHSEKGECALEDDVDEKDESGFEDEVEFEFGLVLLRTHMAPSLRRVQFRYHIRFHHLPYLPHNYLYRILACWSTTGCSHFKLYTYVSRTYK